MVFPYSRYLMTVSVFDYFPLFIIIGMLAPELNKSCAAPTLIECPLIPSINNSLSPAFCEFTHKVQLFVPRLFFSAIFSFGFISLRRFSSTSLA